MHNLTIPLQNKKPGLGASWHHKWRHV